MKFQIARIYMKDVSFENPLSPGIFGEEWNPEVDMQMNAGGRQLEGSLYEATLKVEVRAELNSRPAMVVEALFAGLFVIEEASEEDVAQMLRVSCPAILYPYAREAISDLSVRGGFPPFLMQPVDFVELARQNQGEGAGNGAPAAADADSAPADAAPSSC